MYRDINHIPVLAKAGGIIPLTEEISAPEAGKNPDSLRIVVHAGADGEFVLYEDDNVTLAYADGICAKTRMLYREVREQEEREGKGGRAVFVMEPTQGELSLIPAQREITVEFTGFLPEAAKDVKVILDGEILDGEQMSVSYDKNRQAVVVWIETVKTGEKLAISLPLALRSKENAVDKRIYDFLNQAEISFVQKDEIFELVKKERRIPVLLSQLSVMGIDHALYEVLAELLTGMMA